MIEKIFFISFRRKKCSLNLDYKRENIKISKKLLSINFENIKNFELSINNITAINPLKSFQNCNPLKTLNILSNNKITHIEDLYYCDNSSNNIKWKTYKWS